MTTTKKKKKKMMKKRKRRRRKKRRRRCSGRSIVRRWCTFVLQNLLKTLKTMVAGIC